MVNNSIMKIKNAFFLLFIVPSVCFSQYIPFNSYVYDNSNTGYYFFSSFKQNSNPSTGKPALMILDDKGKTVFYRIFENGLANDFKLAPNKMMSYTFGAVFMLMDSTFRVKDSVVCKNGILTDGHDLQILTNGHYLILGYETKVMDLSSYNWFNGNGSPGSTTAQVKCGVIQELDENKNLVWQWKASEYFQFADVQEAWLDNPTNVDWTHCNAVEMDTDGNVILSSRYFSEVTKINKATGAIMWRLGGKNNQFTFQNDVFNGFYGQHDPRRSSAGKLTLFDNGKAGSPFHAARGVEYQLDEINKVANLVWSYTLNSSSVSGAMGSVGKLSNGNYLICGGRMSNYRRTIVSSNPIGSKVFEVNFPDTSTSYRAFNYTSLPFGLNRPVITCYAEGGINYLDAGTGYTSYQWSTGATTQRIEIAALDTYYVFVNYGVGMLSSERRVVNNLSNPCSSTGLTSNGNQVVTEYKLFQNYPNPFNPSTNIRFTVPKSEFVTLKIYNTLGKVMQTLVNEYKPGGDYLFSFDASDYPSGVYYYMLETSSFSETCKMLLIK